MILTIAGADFSGANIGANTSVGISYNGRVTGKPTSIEKNTALTSTITINTGYTYDSITSVTVGGQSISEYTAKDNGDGTVTLTIPANKITGKVVVTVSTTATSTGGGTVEPEQPGTGGGDAGEYESYIGSEYYTETGYRVSYNSTSTTWKPSISGSTSAGTDYLPISSNDLIWINYVAVVNNLLGSGGFYDANKNFVAPLYWDTFGLDQASLAASKFVTPENPVTISDIEQSWNCSIKYVRFIAWAAADNNNGLTTTEARIYRNDEIVEEVYTEYIGDDVFSINKYNLPVTDGVASETFTGSASAWATDYIPVNINQKIWLEYIFTMSEAHRCIGIYDSSKALIYSVKYSDFGLSSGGKFQTPSDSIAISSIVPADADVAYVRFIAWDTSDGGRSNTSAIIYE